MSIEPATANLSHILALTGPADGRTRVLKHADTFAVFDHHGDIQSGGLGEGGLYREGTRYLSALSLEMALSLENERVRPFFLDSGVGPDGDRLTVALTNPDLLADGRLRLPIGTIHLTLTQFLWQATLYQELHLTNHGRDPVALSLGWRFQADYADIYEVRGLPRIRRGMTLPPVVTPDRVTLAYHGLDDVLRKTVLRCEPVPTSCGPSAVRYDLQLEPREALTVTCVISCLRGFSEHATYRSVRAARRVAEADLERRKAADARIHTSNTQVDAWIARAAADLRLLTTELPTGSYPYAGIPWFNTPFGRDGIITALETLWYQPALARGVLAYLAATQSTDTRPDEDAQPGKILHETRSGEMAVLKEMPFGRYYGSVDATPLFVVLAGAYFERTGDLEFIRSVWPAIIAALGWIDRDGDVDGDGFVEYRRQSSAGLIHQGWKDADDAIVHADGSIATGAIALAEVQGYVYAARRAAARLAAVVGEPARAQALLLQAKALRAAFDQTFWCDELDAYALALDGDKRVCRVRSSNAGHCLFSGIAKADRAARIASTLLGNDLFSGWGVRTLGATEARYNPMGYHTGAVWPHDTAIVAKGLARYGYRAEAARICDAMFEASLTFDGQRMPELFCGFARQPTPTPTRQNALGAPGRPPVPYPLACAPQAWAAGAVLMLLQACLGLHVDGRRARVVLTDPHLPAAVRELSIHGLRVRNDDVVDLCIFRHGRTVGVNVLRRDGIAQVLLR